MLAAQMTNVFKASGYSFPVSHERHANLAANINSITVLPEEPVFKDRIYSQSEEGETREEASERGRFDLE
jgi:hypothetical protein